MAAQPDEIEERALAIVDTPHQLAPATLFGTDDPAAFVVKTTKVADALAGVINQRKLYSVIKSNQGDKKFVNVEGWTFVGSMVGVFPVVRWTRPITADGMEGWEARVEAVTRSGDVVGAAEAMCLKGESKNWHKQSGDNAVRSMAQSRATSKALRGPLDFLVKMAGYVATPAEEIEGSYEPADREPVVAGGQAKPSTPASPPAPRANAPKNAIRINQSTQQPSQTVETPTEDGQATRLYLEALDLGKQFVHQLAVKKGEAPPDGPGLAAQALGSLDAATTAKYGKPLDRLDATELSEVIARMKERLGL